jgi:putative transposon-encoded protein
METKNKGKEKGEVKKKEVNLGNLIRVQIAFEDIEEILEREVFKFGNSGRISIPAKHIGKKAQITIWKKQQEENKK